jgi:hypothetical protein
MENAFANISSADRAAVVKAAMFAVSEVVRGLGHEVGCECSVHWFTKKSLDNLGLLLDEVSLGDD